MANIVSIAFFAFLGGSGRYLIGQGIPTPTGFPWATVLVNLIGSGGLAWLSHAKRVTAHWPSAITVGLGVGGVGAFTTFSTFSVDVVRLLQQQRWGLAAGYLAVTLVGGLLCSWLGLWSARKWGTFPVVEG
ncbi:fluoride efflux transporter FluC [Levilactobacillus yonginensis]|uniref:fluoride efflux transporter FluC n=1 Tax=Levilactobacillus yonginensis TaxID=1054041 RepID=UPI000F785C28|nr:CrcB family protein [Levilactobacillus yonginensis]